MDAALPTICEHCPEHCYLQPWFWLDTIKTAWVERNSMPGVHAECEIKVNPKKIIKFSLFQILWVSDKSHSALSKIFRAPKAKNSLDLSEIANNDKWQMIGHPRQPIALAIYSLKANCYQCLAVSFWTPVVFLSEQHQTSTLSKPVRSLWAHRQAWFINLTCCKISLMPWNWLQTFENKKHAGRNLMFKLKNPRPPSQTWKNKWAHKLSKLK